MENYFKRLKISDFGQFKNFTNHKLPLSNYESGTIHISLSTEIIHSKNSIFDKLFENTVTKIEYHILESIFSKFKLTLREEFFDLRFDKEIKFHLQFSNTKNVILGHHYFQRFLEFLVTKEPHLYTLNQTERTYQFSEIMKFYGVGIYHIKPNLNKNLQVENCQFYSFDEMCFDICDFNYYLSEDYLHRLVNLQVNFKYYTSLINPCKFYLIENESSPNYIKFTRELRNNKISEILYDKGFR